ncbi:hypothetical protein BN3456_00435 [Clostridium sp. C105KSO13]|nr:hypothetical protein BN3456_00435 [Clostridium sp. C105KSO13]
MKTMLGEYGKLIILVILLGGMIPLLMGTGKGSLTGMIKNVRPAATLKDKDSYPLAESILSRKPPELSVKAKKLYRGQVYNLLDAEAFLIKVKTDGGEAAKVSVTKVTDPKEKDITKEVDPEKFMPVLPGKYRIVYRVADSFLGSTKTTEKEYSFIAD